MKTHINQIFTVVGFFSMSLTTTLAISWGMNGLMIDETKMTDQCPEKKHISIQANQSDVHKALTLSIRNGIKVFIPKITLKSNG